MDLFILEFLNCNQNDRKRTFLTNLFIVSTTHNETFYIIFLSIKSNRKKRIFLIY